MRRKDECELGPPNYYASILPRVGIGNMIEIQMGLDNRIHSIMNEADLLQLLLNVNQIFNLHIMGPRDKRDKRESIEMLIGSNSQSGYAPYIWDSLQIFHESDYFFDVSLR